MKTSRKRRQNSNVFRKTGRKLEGCLRASVTPTELGVRASAMSERVLSCGPNRWSQSRPSIPSARPAKAVRSPTRRVITCTSRRRLGASARISNRIADGKFHGALRHGPLGRISRQPIFLRRQICPHSEMPQTARDQSPCARAGRPNQSPHSWMIRIAFWERPQWGDSQCHKCQGKDHRPTLTVHFAPSRGLLFNHHPG
jgi:hypothetical protein